METLFTCRMLHGWEYAHQIPDEIPLRFDPITFVCSLIGSGVTKSNVNNMLPRAGHVSRV